LRESLFEDLHQQSEQEFLISVSDRFLFHGVYCCNVGHAGILLSLQERCRRNKLMLG